jgi:integrase
MAVQRIGKRLLDALQPEENSLFIWDEEVSGFGVKVTPTGRKIFIAQYRVAGAGRRSTTKRLTLGEYGILTPDEARRLAKRELGKVAQGLDPAADRAGSKGAATVNQLGKAYLEDVRLRRKTTTAREYERLWKKHVIPSIGLKTVATVSPQDIRRIHRSLSDTPYVANRSVALLGAFFSFAAREGVRPANDNPTSAIEHYAEEPRHRFLTEAEFRRLGQALVRAETKGLPTAPEYRKTAKSEKTRKHRPKSADRPIPANPFAVAAIRLLALTGCRENEILSLKWDAVDFERGHLRLADTKTGASVRPLGASAALVLQALPRLEGNPYVLPGMKNGEHIGDVQRLWYAVRHAARLDEVRLHDLRHSFASVPATSGESMLVLRSLLGHKHVATTERYAHLGDDPLKRAADRASGDIARWLADDGPAMKGATPT